MCCHCCHWCCCYGCYAYLFATCEPAARFNPEIIATLEHKRLTMIRVRSTSSSSSSPSTFPLPCVRMNVRRFYELFFCHRSLLVSLGPTARPLCMYVISSAIRFCVRKSSVGPNKATKILLVTSVPAYLSNTIKQHRRYTEQRRKLCPLANLSTNALCPVSGGFSA